MRPGRKGCGSGQHTQCMHPGNTTITVPRDGMAINMLTLEINHLKKNCGVNDKSLGTCGGPKQPEHNNISVIDGTCASKCILGTDERVLVGCKCP